MRRASRCFRSTLERPRDVAPPYPGGWRGTAASLGVGRPELNFDVLEVYCAIAVYYLLLTSLWDVAQRALERRANRGHTDGPGVRSVPAIVEG